MKRKSTCFKLLLALFLCFIWTPANAEMCSSFDYNIRTIEMGKWDAFGIKEGGTVAVSGSTHNVARAKTWTNIKSMSVSTSSNIMLGLKEDGTVEGAWSTTGGVKTIDLSSWTNIKAVAADNSMYFGLKEDGTVIWGGNDGYHRANVSYWTNIKDISTGSGSTFGLKEDGTVVSVGANYEGQRNVSSWSNIKAISGGGAHTVGLKEDGTVVAVGDSSYGQLNVDSWTDIVAISAGGWHTIGLKADGSVVATGHNRLGQTNVSSWSNVVAISAGQIGSMALKEDGSVVAVGFHYAYRHVSLWPIISQAACLYNQPLAPSALTASDISCDNGGSIALSWSLSEDDPFSGTGSNAVTAYNLYRAETEGGPYSPLTVVPAGSNSYIDNSAASGNSYYYLARATDNVMESADSNEASGIALRNLPLAPANLMASDTPYDLGNSVTLEWLKSSDDGQGLNNVSTYNIYRYSSTDGRIRTLSNVSPGIISYVDSTVLDNNLYYYFIKSFDNSCSAESNSSNLAEGQSVNNFTALPDVIATLPGISPKLLNSLTAKIENAIKAYERGNTNAAINLLNAALNEISAQTGKKISEEAASELTRYIRGIISSL